MADVSDVGESWFAVRCVLRSGWPPQTEGIDYEERITLWRATSAAEAIERAEEEAREYAAAIEDAPSTYLDIAQSYQLSDVPGDGAEVYSLIRTSSLEPQKYLDTFFDTGTERQTSVQ